MNTVPRSHSPFLQPPWIAALAVPALSLGCGQPPTPEAPPAQLQQKSINAQGMSLQGTSLQGRSLQGMSLQGMSLQGTSLQGISLQGTSLQGVPLGAAIHVTGVDQQASQLRIDQIEADPQDASGETLLYTVKVWDAAGQAWQDLCAPTPDGERRAIPVSGYWDSTGAHIDDPTRFTFGCTSGVIAKCVRWGYKPWKSDRGVPLAPYHQACTRMARADYCGTGHSYTRDGTWIDMFDALRLQRETKDSGMQFEAQWTPRGAYCIAHTRWSGQLPTGEWLSSLIAADCGLKNITFLFQNLGDEDACYFARKDVSASEVLMSNKSFLNRSTPTY